MDFVNRLLPKWKKHSIEGLTLSPERDVDNLVEKCQPLSFTPDEEMDGKNILKKFGLNEKEIITLMRREMKSKSFAMWRKRVQGRKTKHLKLRDDTVNRFKCTRQRTTGNKISKRD